MRMSSLQRRGCAAPVVLAMTAFGTGAQQFDERIENTVQHQVFDSGGNGTPDSASPGSTIIKFTNGNINYAVIEYDIRTLNAGDIELALIGGNIEVSSTAANVGLLPTTYEFTLYSANGIMDISDVAGTLEVLGQKTYTYLGMNAFGFDITDTLKDRINAGDDYIGLRIEGVGSFAQASLPKPSTFDPRVDIYIHEVNGGNQTPDEDAPSGTPSVVDTGDTFHFKGTNNNDVLIVDKSGSNVRFRNSTGTTYGTFPESAASQIRIDLYKGNDSASVYTTVNLPAIIYGGGGNDTLNGSKKDDILYGGNGNDNLNGNSGNDRLYGGDGEDTLKGGNGHDSLFGGFMVDTLTGNSGDDRFLVRLHSADTITDASADEVVSTFADADDAITGTGTFPHGFWSDIQIQHCDEAFDYYHDYFGDNVLLKTFDVMQDIEWYKPVRYVQRGERTSGSDPGAASAGGERVEFSSYIWPTSATATPDFGVRVTTHELGHIHDTFTLEGFYFLRGWVRNPSSTSGLTSASTGASWYYDTGIEGFVSSYSMTRAGEDFADSFEEFLLNNTQYEPVPLTPIENLPILNAYMDDFVDHLDGVSYDSVIWFEDFFGLADGTTDDNVSRSPDSDWTTDVSNVTTSNPYRAVQSQQMEFGITAGGQNESGYGVWESESIEVWRHDSVTVSFDVKSIGVLEATGPWQDYIVAEMVVDGVTTVIFDNPGDISTGSTYTTVSANVPSTADELFVRFRWKTTGEKYVIDNVFVEGTRAAPPLAQ